jgi:hypothetical protein
MDYFQPNAFVLGGYPQGVIIDPPPAFFSDLFDLSRLELDGVLAPRGNLRRPPGGGFHGEDNLHPRCVSCRFGEYFAVLGMGLRIPKGLRWQVSWVRPACARGAGRKVPGSPTELGRARPPGMVLAPPDRFWRRSPNRRGPEGMPTGSEPTRNSGLGR